LDDLSSTQIRYSFGGDARRLTAKCSRKGEEDRKENTCAVQRYARNGRTDDTTSELAGYQLEDKNIIFNIYVEENN
jgi:hypothetical protein